MEMFSRPYYGVKTNLLAIGSRRRILSRRLVRSVFREKEKAKPCKCKAGSREIR